MREQNDVDDNNNETTTGVLPMMMMMMKNDKSPIIWNLFEGASNSSLPKIEIE